MQMIGPFIEKSTDEMEPAMSAARPLNDCVASKNCCSPTDSNSCQRVPSQARYL